MDNIQKTDGIVEKLVNIKRHSKTVKGGKIISFAALSVVGNLNGRAGMGRGKSREVPIAIKKSMENAKKNMIQFNINGDTLWYSIFSCHGASKVFMKPASQGTGIIACNAVRAVFESMGIRNVLTKIYGSTNPINVIIATLKGMSSFESPEDIAEKRSYSIKNIRT